MHMQPCPCFNCHRERTPLINRSSKELIHFVETYQDDLHAFARVFVYIELCHRFRIDTDTPGMPYRIWRTVMGDVPPPYSAGAVFGAGAFPIYHDWNRPWSWQ